MIKEKKEARISELLNNRNQNSLFIDVQREQIDTNKNILAKLYHEKLLDKFLDDYFNYRMKTDNYNKKGEYLRSLEAYINLFSDKAFKSDHIFFDENKLEDVYINLKEKLKFAIENYDLTI